MVTAFGGSTDEIPPAAATDIMASDAAGDAGVMVSWMASADDRYVSYDFAGNPYIRGVTEYQVFRRALGDEEFSLVGAVPYGSTSLTDATAGYAEYYEYLVKASDGTYLTDSGVSNTAFAADDVKAALGDFNSSGKVDIPDFFMLADAYGAQEGDANYYGVLDIAPVPGDGKIDYQDFFLFAENFGLETGEALAKAVPTRLGVNLETVLDMSVLRDEMEDFTLRVTLDKATDLSGYGFVVKYDASVFEFGRAVATDVSILAEGGSTAPLLVVSDKPGELVVANALRSGQSVAGAGLAADLTFTLKDPMGGDVRVIDAMAVDAHHRVNGIGVRTASVTATPKVFALKQNYPNPFNPATTIEYALPEAASVRLEVYNTLAQVVATLVAEEQTSGRYSVRWDGLNSNGELVGSGVYFYRLVAGDFQDIKRMLLIK
jgi:hypothetical protein